MTKPYPLNWIPGKSRTPSYKRKRSQFQVSFTKARDDLLIELKRLEATQIVISSNVEIRRDGLPYSNRRNPDDPGAAVYFKSFKKEYVLGCDRWDRVKDNLRAIGKHIEALRGIERWGVSSVEEAFEPFLLPTASPTYRQNLQNDTFSSRLLSKSTLTQNATYSWWTVLNVSPNASVEEIKQAYKKLSLTHHPDVGGDRNEWERLSKAYQEALKLVSV
jgi:hypothetical protein